MVRWSWLGWALMAWGGLTIALALAGWGTNRVALSLTGLGLLVVGAQVVVGGRMRAGTGQNHDGPAQAASENQADDGSDPTLPQ